MWNGGVAGTVCFSLHKLLWSGILAIGDKTDNWKPGLAHIFTTKP